MKTAAKPDQVLTAFASASAGADQVLTAHAFVPMTEAESPALALDLAWMPVLPPLGPDGTVSTRDGRGPFTYNLAEVVANTRANAADIPVYLDHVATGSAYGWLAHAAEPRKGTDGGYEWPVEYTDDGTRLVTSKAYRYTSMGFRFIPDAACLAARAAGNFDAQSGRIVSFFENSLVTRPALPVRAVASDGAGYTGHQPSATLIPMNAEQLILLGLTAAATEADITAALTALNERASAAATATASVSEAAAAHAAALTAVQGELAVAKTAAETAQAALDALRAEQAAAQAQAAEAAATAAVDAAITAGKFVPAAREALLTQARASIDAFNALAAAMPTHPAVASGSAAALATQGVQPAETHGLTAEQLATCEQLDIKPEAYAAALATVKAAA